MEAKDLSMVVSRRWSASLDNCALWLVELRGCVCCNLMWWRWLQQVSALGLEALTCIWGWPQLTFEGG